MSTQTGGRRRMERGLIQGQAPPAMLGHSQTPTWDTPGRPRNRREMTVMASPGSCGSTWGSVGWLGRRVCTGPPEQSVNIKHLGSPHGGPWPLGTHRPVGETQVQGVPPEVAYDSSGRLFLLTVPRGTPSTKEPLHIS